MKESASQGETPPRRSQAPRLGSIVLGALLGASLGVFLLAFHLADAPTGFGATARLQAAPPADATGPGRRAWEDFLANSGYDVESGQVPRDAWERLRQLHPGMPLCDVSIQAVPDFDHGIIVVTATGEESRCVTSYLELLVEAFLIARQGGATPPDPVPPGHFILLEHARTFQVAERNDTFALVQAGYLGAMAGGVVGFLLSWWRGRKVGALERGMEESGPAAQNSSGGDLSASQAMAAAGLPRAVAGVFFALAAGALLGTLFQLTRVLSRPQEFRSLAKVVDVDAPDPTPPTRQHLQIIAALESEELHRATLKRLQTLHPEFKTRRVQVRVAQTKGAAIFHVLATGPEPAYTRVFLDTLIDAFMASPWRTQFGKVMVQERATLAAENVEDWQVPLLTGALVGGVAGAGCGCLGWLWRRRARPMV